MPRGYRWGHVSGPDLFRAACLANVLALAVLVTMIVARTDPHRNMAAYYQLGARLHAGEPMYWPLPPLLPQVQDVLLYLYPPTFAAFFALAPVASWATFSHAWSAVVCAALLAYGVLLARLAGRMTVWGVLGALLVLMWWPGTGEVLVAAQVDPLLWVIFAAAFAWPRSAGFALAFAGLLKPFAVVAFVAGLVRYRWRYVAGAAAAGAFAVLLGTVAFGWTGHLEAWRAWFAHVLPSFSQGSWSPTNYSLTMFPLRAARHLGWIADGRLPALASAYLSLASLAVPAVVAWALRRRSWALQGAASVAATVLAAPICWNYYLPALLLAPAALLGEQRAVATGQAWRAIPFAAADDVGSAAGHAEQPVMVNPPDIAGRRMAGDRPHRARS